MCKCKKDECVNKITGNVLNTSNVFTYLTCRLKTHQKSGVYTLPLYENKKYLKYKTKKKLKCKTLLLCECILLLSVKHPHSASAKNSVHSTFLHSAFQKPALNYICYRFCLRDQFGLNFFFSESETKLEM
jgi:hypothetical protein